ncbi:hypothetical protein F4824DRAFT_463403 [Ustulina deusta]|nr:hypothetical protein F4824DRAFT_463403 [Ustulina deusta]
MEFIYAEPAVYFVGILWDHPGTLFWRLEENVLALGCRRLPCYAPLFRAQLQTRKARPSYSDHGGSNNINP